jgi:alkylhydroperoxidase/carboxymuconolactone decarboxylase family protein YurZ
MEPQRLLTRPGLSSDLRILIGLAVAAWHADWQRLILWSELARKEDLPRANLEETLLQCALFCGFPRAITAFEHLQKIWPKQALANESGVKERDRKLAGSELFRTIYGKNDKAVRAMLQDYHQELHDFVLEAAYGRILSRSQLSAKKRELIAVAVLAAQGQKKQFAGHARGAIHLGATKTELREALVTGFGEASEHDQLVDTWFAMIP